MGQSFWVRAIAPEARLIIREGVKAASDASFYRPKHTGISGFCLRLSRDGVTDKACFKVRAHTSDSLDAWDAVKLPNEQLNLAFMSDQNNVLAIDARRSIPCEGTEIKIYSEGLLPGRYTLLLTTRFALTNFKYFLIDRFLNTETELLPDSSTYVDVTSSDASQALDRFSIRLQRPPILYAADTVVGYDRPAVLRCTSSDRNVAFAWFDSSVSIDTLSKMSQLITLPLKQSRIFFVCGTSSDGCSTRRLPVHVQVVPYQHAPTTHVFDSTHSDMINHQIRCDNFVSPDNYRDDKKKRAVYPNPTTGKVVIQHEVATSHGETRNDAEDPPEVYVINALGFPIERIVTTRISYDQVLVDLTSLPAGEYVIVVRERTRTDRIVIVKM